METLLYSVGTVIGGERPDTRARIIRPDSWRAALPTLTVPGATLPELRGSDARSLFALLTTVEVSRFISPPPATVEGFDTFIAWAQKKRAADEYLCFGIVANAVIDFAFERIGVSQLGARAMVDNHRGSGALRKMGAVREGLLPGAFVRDGRAHDQYYWTLTPDDRPRRKIVWEEPLH